MKETNEKNCKPYVEKIHMCRGITLVALVITIILMLILAGIVFSLLLGEHGIIKMAQQAGKNYVDAQQEEKNRLDELYSTIFVAANDDAQINISVKDLKSLIEEEVQNAVEGMKKEVSKNATPIGAIISQMGNTAPEGYLICDGTVYNIEQYKELAEYIQSQFGKSNYWGGDGQTTFAVPPLRGEFLRGSGINIHTGNGNGANVGVHQNPTIHYNGVWGTGTTSNEIALFQYGGIGEVNAYRSDNLDTYVSSNKRTRYSGMYHIRAVENYEGVESFTSRPTNTSVLYCIKY